MSSTPSTKSPPPQKAPNLAAAPKVEPAASPAPEPTASDAEKREVLVRIAAYSFYERRGFVGGHELEDWLQAEMEVDRQLAEQSKPAQPT